MYVFVMEQITKLEERLLELLTETEAKASKESGTNWALVPRNFRFSTNIALCWLPVRAKALELVKQRDALGSRVLFAQMSMLSSYVSHFWGCCHITDFLKSDPGSRITIEKTRTATPGKA